MHTPGKEKLAQKFQYQIYSDITRLRGDVWNKFIIEIFMHVFLLLMGVYVILADCIYIYITMHIAPFK